MPMISSAVHRRSSLCLGALHKPGFLVCLLPSAALFDAPHHIVRCCRSLG
jgi:hypothetical protein